jgi:hypothetical protein
VENQPYIDSTNRSGDFTSKQEAQRYQFEADLTCKHLFEAYYVHHGRYSR